MKLTYIFALFFLFIGGLFSVNAQDLIILRDGNVIESKVTEITPTEIKYKRFNHLDGPVIVIARTDVQSIRYENKTVEIINPASTAGQERNRPGQHQDPQPDTPVFPQSNEITLLQQVLNRMPAIHIAGNSLKFEFRGDTWISRVSGEDFSAGTIEYEKTDEGFILTLKQTHIWPGAIGKTAGRVANIIPGGGTAGRILNTAGNIAGAVGAVEMPGLVIILEYKAGPPASLKFLSSSQNDTSNTRVDDEQNAKNNWISFNFGFSGIGVRYERMLHPRISLGANIFWHFMPLISLGGNPFENQAVGIDAAFRVYPGDTFYLGVALGFYYVYGILDIYEYNDYYYYDVFYSTSHSFALGITPEVGWKVDVGKKGGLFLQWGISALIVLGEKESDVTNIINQEGFGFINVFPRFFFGMGYAF